jgi:hypothetical protein
MIERIMKALFFLLIFVLSYGFSQSVPPISESDSSKAQSHVDSTKQTDSVRTVYGVKLKQTGNVYTQRSGEINITVNPHEAGDAVLMIIQKDIVYGQSGADITSDLPNPDTIGTWYAPLKFLLYEGNYNIIAKEDGFRDEMQRVVVRSNAPKNISINMYSFSYLQQKNAQWNTVKWICAAAAVGSGIASYFIHAKRETLLNEYNNAMSQSVINDKRNSISQYRRYYTISTAMTFTFIGGFGVSWLIQDSY